MIFFTATPHGQVSLANHPALQTGLTHSHHDIKMGLGLPRSLPPQNPVPQQAHTPSTTGTHPGLMLGLFASWLPALIVRYCSPLSVGCWVFLWHPVAKFWPNPGKMQSKTRKNNPLLSGCHYTMVQFLESED